MMLDESQVSQAAYSAPLAAEHAAFAARRRWLLLAAASFVVLVLAGVLYSRLREDVQIVVYGGEPLAAHAFGGTVATALAAAHVHLAPTDRVSPPLTTPLVDGMQILVQATFPVEFTLAGQTQTVRAVAETVEAFLREAGVKLNPLDIVTPELSHTLHAGDAVRVVRVRQAVVTEVADIPYPVKRWADPALPKGQTRVEKPGQPGRARQTYRVTYHDDQEVARTLVAAEVLTPPQAEIIGVGTRPVYHTVKTPQGNLRYTKVLTLVATAYYPGPLSTGASADGLTSTGLAAKRGVVAVDPTVIPLGTRLYIPGYGLAVAGDVGSAIKGNRIDLLFDTYQEAIQFGRQTVKVYVLSGN